MRECGIPQVEEGSNRDNRSKNLKPKFQSINKTGGYFLQATVFVRDHGDQNQDEKGSSSHKASGISSLQLEQEHGQEVRQI